MAGRDAMLTASQSPQLQLGDGDGDYYQDRVEHQAAKQKKKEKKQKVKASKKRKGMESSVVCIKKAKTAENEANDRTKWTDEMRTILVDELSIASGSQKKHSDGSGFKPSEWKSIRENFNDRANVNLTKQQLQSYNDINEHHDLLSCNCVLALFGTTFQLTFRCKQFDQFFKAILFHSCCVEKQILVLRLH